MKKKSVFTWHTPPIPTCGTLFGAPLKAQLKGSFGAMLDTPFGAMLGATFLVTCLALNGCRLQVDETLPTSNRQPVNVQATRSREPEGKDAPEGNEGGKTGSEPVVATETTPALKIKVEPVTIPAWSNDPLSLPQHFHISGCRTGIYTIGYEGGHGRLFQEGNGHVLYRAPTQYADPEYKIKDDTVTLHIECEHGDKADAVFHIHIAPPNVGSHDSGIGSGIASGIAGATGRTKNAGTAPGGGVIRKSPSITARQKTHIAIQSPQRGQCVSRLCPVKGTANLPDGTVLKLFVTNRFGVTFLQDVRPIVSNGQWHGMVYIGDSSGINEAFTIHVMDLNNAKSPPVVVTRTR